MDTQASRIIRKFGTQDKLAKLVGRSQTTVSYWLQVGTIPAHCQGKVRDAAKSLGIELTYEDWFPSES